MLKLGPSSAKALESLEEQGISAWPSQTDQPVLPREISSLTSTELSNYFTRLTAWSDYVAVQLSAAQVDEVTIEKQLTAIQNSLLNSKMSSAVKGDRITLVKAQVSQDPKVIKLEKEWLEVYAYRKMVETIYNNLDRDTTLISREISRRSGDQTMRKGNRST